MLAYKIRLGIGQQNFKLAGAEWVAQHKHTVLLTCRTEGRSNYLGDTFPPASWPGTQEVTVVLRVEKGG